MRNVSYDGTDEDEDDEEDEDEDEGELEESALGFRVQNAPSKCGLPI